MAAASASSVLRKIRENRDQVRRYGVKRLGLFGSAARGEAGKRSDLDFLVEFERKTFDDYMGLKFYLEGLFRKKVDLVVAETIKARLRPAILREVTYAEGL